MIQIMFFFFFNEKQLSDISRRAKIKIILLLNSLIDEVLRFRQYLLSGKNCQRKYSIFVWLDVKQESVIEYWEHWAHPKSSTQLITNQLFFISFMICVAGHFEKKNEDFMCKHWLPNADGFVCCFFFIVSTVSNSKESK